MATDVNENIIVISEEPTLLDTKPDQFKLADIQKIFKIEKNKQKIQKQLIFKGPTGTKCRLNLKR